MLERRIHSLGREGDGKEGFKKRKEINKRERGRMRRNMREGRRAVGSQCNVVWCGHCGVLLNTDIYFNNVCHVDFEER